MSRPERQAFNIEEAIILLEYRNFKNIKNEYLPLFKEFIKKIERIIV